MNDETGIMWPVRRSTRSAERPAPATSPTAPPLLPTVYCPAADAERCVRNHNDQGRER
jgi:hypothetical protein